MLRSPARELDRFPHRAVSDQDAGEKKNGMKDVDTAFEAYVRRRSIITALVQSLLRFRTRYENPPSRKS
jgi:hypothetical protein